MENTKKFTQSRAFPVGKSIFQRIFITSQFYNRNGLANHAAGGAYGFLLSAAPTLLLISIFLLILLRSSPYAIFDLITRELSFLEIIFNEDKVIENIINISASGIAGVFSVISIMWAGRIFALTLQRGLKVTFSGNKKRNPVKENLITLLIQFGVLIFILVLIISSQSAVYILDNLKYLPKTVIDFLSMLRSRIFPFAALGIISYAAYQIIPANPPRHFSALQGALVCVIPYSITSLVLHFIINKTRYNFLYGTLGDLIVLLVSVYFFFIFFYIGAQFAKVTDSLDVLLFSNLLKARNESTEKHKGFFNKLFINPTGSLLKYIRHYNTGDIIINRGDKGNEIFYLLDGKVEVSIRGFFKKSHSDNEPPSGSAKDSRKPAPVLDAGVFFGEMEHLLSGKRTASIRAISDSSVLALPPQLFEDVLNSDTGVDRALINNLTQRLKAANERILNPDSTAPGNF
jgi:membrane protein